MIATADRLPWSGALVIAGSLAVGGVLVVVVTRRAARGELARNHLAGVRTPATLASDRAWLAAHRAALPATTVGGAIAIAGSLLLLLRPGPAGTLVLLAVVGGGLLAGVIGGAVQGVRAARAVADGPDPSDPD